MPTFERFPMPDAGEGLTEAEIVTWHVAVGDRVKVNQVILEIETAKSLVELPCPFDGIVTELHGAEGDVVDVGTVIMVVDVAPDGPAVSTPDLPAQEQDLSQAEPVAAPTTPSEPATQDQASATAPSQAPEPVSTSTVTAAAPAAVLGVAEEESGSVLVGYGISQGSTKRRPRRPDVHTVQRPAGDEAVRSKPPVRKLARDLGVDLNSVTPTGPGSLITREDVLAASAQTEAKPLATYASDVDAPWLASGKVSSDGRQTRVPVKSVRRRTAEAMVASAFTAPHVTVFQTVDVTKTMRLVKMLREDREFADVRVTPLLITAKALLLAINRHPEIAASWDDEAQEIVYKHYVNLGIAAATSRGLVVPNIKNAHRLGLKGLAEGIAELTSKARASKTSLADMTDGTVTITNVGVFGIDTGTPILNPGESAILAFGAIREQPWVHKGKIKKRMVTQLALSFDHRLVDGELGARVLADVAAVLEEPGRGLVWA
ncbi:dihydrolipoamide acetyltransferase family protein [Jonesiaceae bacterium BS-20]|uniref:Dihydrolipoamide acetyltransferase component of pyruvate dehydrogenase complex n=1 Tax=Jonesiaceae bacterium BS-20 TaxID=3120821 RepID=A0AAU7DWQ2_9MICO